MVSEPLCRPPPPPGLAVKPHYGSEQCEARDDTGIDKHTGLIALSRCQRHEFLGWLRQRTYQVRNPLGNLEAQHEGNQAPEASDVDQSRAGKMRVALENVHSSDGIRTEEAEGHETKGEQEQVVAVLFGVLASEAEEDRTDQGTSSGKSQVQQLVLGNTLASLLGDQVGSPICEASSDDTSRNSCDEDWDQAQANTEERPSRRSISTTINTILDARHSRPRLGQQRWSNGVPGSKSTSNHSAVQHGDEEDLRVEEGPQGVDEGIPALSPLHRTMCKGEIVLPATLVLLCGMVDHGDSVYDAVSTR